MFFTPRCQRIRLRSSLTFVWFGPGRRRPGALTPCKNESKSWALPAVATNRKNENFSNTPRVFSSYRFSAHLYKSIEGGLGHAHQGVVHPMPTRPLCRQRPNAARRARERSAQFVAEKLSNRECRAEECRQHQNESVAPGGLANGGFTRERARKIGC